MTATEQERAQWKTSVLLFNGNTHNLNSVLSTARSGQLIEVAVNQIDLDSVTAKDAVTVKPADVKVHELDLVLYKFNGVYLVLTGRNHVLDAKTNGQTTIQGRLMTSVTLKKTRVIKPDAVPVTTLEVASARRPPSTAPRFPTAMEESFRGANANQFGRRRG
jgi:hypothetical protein